MNTFLFFVFEKKLGSYLCFDAQIDWFGFDFKCFKLLSPRRRAAAVIISIHSFHVSCLFLHSSVNYSFFNEAYNTTLMSFGNKPNLQL